MRPIDQRQRTVLLYLQAMMALRFAQAAVHPRAVVVHDKPPPLVVVAPHRKKENPDD